MKNQGYKIFVSFLALIFTSIFSIAIYADEAVTPYNKIVFLGDSLSDNGNLYDADFGAIPKSPPYFQGRFSNGYVWSEYVAKYFYDKNFMGSTNLAVGGETTILHNPFNGYMPYTLSLSIDKYLLHTLRTDRSSTFFIIWISANDYLPGTDNGDKLSSAVVGAIKADIERLIYHGGKNFLVLNLPDLSRTPYAHDKGMEKMLSELTQLHNTKLNNVVSEIHDSYKNVNIHLFDVNTLFLEVLNNIEVYNQKYQIHITDTTTACLNSNNALTNDKRSEESILQQLNQQVGMRSKFKPLHSNTMLPQSLDDRELAHYIAASPALLETYRISESTSDNVQPCKNPDEHVFWDKVHPSAITHMVFSQEILDFINKNYKAA